MWQLWLWFWLLWIVFFPCYLRERAKTTNDDTTALGLVKVAEGLNFETRAFEADMGIFDLEMYLSLHRSRT